MLGTWGSHWTNYNSSKIVSQALLFELLYKVSLTCVTRLWKSVHGVRYNDNLVMWDSYTISSLMNFSEWTLLQKHDRRSNHFSAGVCVGTPCYPQKKRRREEEVPTKWWFSYLSMIIFPIFLAIWSPYHVNNIYLFIYFCAQSMSNVAGVLARKPGSI